LDHRVISGERLPFEEKTFDCAVSTFTLCSIDAVSQAVSEVFRVLKLGGRFLFLEHGLSPEPAVSPLSEVSQFAPTQQVLRECRALDPRSRATFA